VYRIDYSTLVLIEHVLDSLMVKIATKL